MFWYRKLDKVKKGVYRNLAAPYYYRFVNAVSAYIVYTYVIPLLKFVFKLFYAAYKFYSLFLSKPEFKNAMLHRIPETEQEFS